ncbi:hypothetical protein BDN67DRAFT_1006052, partial [Paxillus ammoniavirescens]
IVHNDKVRPTTIFVSLLPSTSHAEISCLPGDGPLRPAGVGLRLVEGLRIPTQHGVVIQTIGLITRKSSTLAPNTGCITINLLRCLILLYES